VSTSNTDERLLDLLVERRDRNLAETEKQELNQRLKAQPGWSEEDLELAEAALWASVETPAMPASLKAKLSETLPAAKVVPIASKRSPAAPLGWLAAALAAGLALFGWWPRLNPPPPPLPVVPPTLAELRGQLLSRPTVKKLDWAAAGDPLVKQIAGDVVWDNERQSGFMRFVGLPKNDPGQNQYQLWIFDAERDERYPVDGGVFDVGSDGEVLVPIDPKVKVLKPTLFAVTLERPGGVVVSSREHILTVAKVL
jgi:hypothetical protein